MGCAELEAAARRYEGAMRIDGKIEVPDGAGERAVRDFYSYNSDVYKRQVVHRRGEEGGAHRVFQREGLHGDQAGRLRDLGEDPGGGGPPLQGDRRGECLHAHVYSGEPSAEGEGPCGGICPRGCLGDPRRPGAPAGENVRETDLHRKHLKRMPLIKSDALETILP